jgi:hypothetical protein
MKRAWVIAREGVKKFGGKVKEYFAEALRIAWAEVKGKAAKFEFELDGDTRRTRTWIAAIVGRHPKFVLDRRFLIPNHEDKYGDKIFYLTPGYYEVFNGKRRTFVKIENGECQLVEKEEVLEVL